MQEPLDARSDADLLARCARGDEEAWEVLVGRYERLVYSEALEVGLSDEDAGDVFQQVWLELHKSIPRIRNPTGLPRWLMVATRRLSYKLATHRRRMVAGVSRELVDPRTLPDDDVEAMETRRRLEDALDRVGGACSHLLRLLFFETERLPYEEIARRTGLAVGSIGPIRSRCLGRVRKILEEST